MRTLPLVVAGFAASVTTSLAIWGALEIDARCSPHYEVLEDRLILTTAPSITLNYAVESVMASNRPPGVSSDDRYDKSQYQMQADSWFERPGLFGCMRECIGRLSMSQIDASGKPMTVEIVRGDDTPAFVFIQHEDPETRAKLAGEIADKLTASGVRPR